jgi:ABC-type dipeptide/oligopeptide/nickel transport system permease subunit
LRLAAGLASVPLTALAIHGAAWGTVAAVLLVASGLAAPLLLELEGLRPGRSRLRRVAGRAGMLLPLALSVELAAEAATDRGLGNLAQRSLAAGELETLIWVAWLLSAAGCLGILLQDIAQRRQEDEPPSSTELVPGSRSRTAVLGAGAVIGLFASMGGLHSLAPSFLGELGQAAGQTLLVTLIVTGVATGVALVLGLLAGGISRTADTLLSRASDLSLALPQPLVAGAVLVLGGALAPAWLGILRGVEVALVLRSRIADQRAAEDIEPPSLGRAPLSPYLRRVLPPVIAPVATALALSGAWVAALEGACATLGASRTESLGTLTAAAGSTSVVASLLVTSLVAALCWLVRDVTPRESSAETPGTTVVLALKRRIDSVRPAAPGPGSEPPAEP